MYSDDSLEHVRCPGVITFINPNPTAPKVYWFPTGCALYLPTILWLFNKGCLANIWFITQTFSELIRHFVLQFHCTLGLSWAEQLLFKMEKNYSSGFCQFQAPKCSLGIVSVSSNNDCSAQNMPRELRFQLEPSRNEDSKYVFKCF
jgi:hypothetical protein